jgi:hypothetical protein
MNESAVKYQLYKLILEAQSDSSLLRERDYGIRGQMETASDVTDKALGIFDKLKGVFGKKGDKGAVKDVEDAKKKLTSAVEELRKLKVKDEDIKKLLDSVISGKSAESTSGGGEAQGAGGRGGQGGGGGGDKAVGGKGNAPQLTSGQPLKADATVEDLPKEDQKALAKAGVKKPGLGLSTALSYLVHEKTKVNKVVVKQVIDWLTQKGHLVKEGRELKLTINEAARSLTHRNVDSYLVLERWQHLAGIDMLEEDFATPEERKAAKASARDTERFAKTGQGALSQAEKDKRELEARRGRDKKKSQKKVSTAAPASSVNKTDKSKKAEPDTASPPAEDKSVTASKDGNGKEEKPKKKKSTEGGGKFSKLANSIKRDLKLADAEEVESVLKALDDLGITKVA